MKVALFKATCGSCSAEFSAPHLGDFAYGEFIFTGELGTVHAFFDANNPVWGFLESVLPKSGESTKEQIARGSLLQATCAYLADAIEGQSLFNHQICPRCQSSKLSSWGGERTGSVELPEASFLRFMAQPESERQRLALAFYSRIAPNKVLKKDAR
jgi:hypothetical protein